MLSATTAEALWFLPFALPIALWVAWSDMKYMRILNQAVLALVAVYLVIGLIALPLEEYLWRWLHLGVVLLIGFLFNAIGWVGGGDAKFAAAMAPFFATGDISTGLYLLAGILLVATGLHRGARRIGAIRRLTPDWVSWENNKLFPMGLALSGTLIFYLVLVARYGQVA